MTGLHRFLPKNEMTIRSMRGAASRITEGLRPAREVPVDLPIHVPQDEWLPVDHKGIASIQRKFQLDPTQVKMVICEIIDAQEVLRHTVHLTIDGDALTVRSTTHEFGEPTERDREIARYIDTAYDEMRSVYK